MKLAWAFRADAERREGMGDKCERKSSWKRGQKPGEAAWPGEGWSIDKGARVAGLGGDHRRHSKAIHARAPVILKSSYIETKKICPRTFVPHDSLDRGQQAKR